MTSTRTVTTAILLAALSSLLFAGCAVLEDMAAAVTNLQRLKFRLGDVHDFRVAGIGLAGKSRLSQFSAADGLKLLDAFRRKTLRAEFVLDVEAVNPNDGTGGSSKTVATLAGLESRLLIDGTPTVTGNIENPVEIPGTGEESVIPIRLSLDLLEFFGDRKYEDLINLVLALGGANRDPSRITLDAQPRVSTPYGPIAYPGRITIVDREFR
jgi:hypothetical protein